jgi:malonate decarboxylase gamma subunit
MKLIEILNALFPAGHEVGTFGQLIAGTAQTSSSTVAVLGTTDAAAIGHDIALGLAGRILDIVDQHPGRPIVFLVDTKGQALSRAEELLCLNGSLAHLARCVDLARRQGHVSVALVTGEAVSGGLPVLRSDGRQDLRAGRCPGAGDGPQGHGPGDQDCP